MKKNKMRKSEGMTRENTTKRSNFRYEGKNRIVTLIENEKEKNSKKQKKETNFVGKKNKISNANTKNWVVKKLPVNFRSQILLLFHSISCSWVWPVMTHDERKKKRNWTDEESSDDSVSDDFFSFRFIVFLYLKKWM